VVALEKAVDPKTYPDELNTKVVLIFVTTKTQQRE